MFWQSTFLSVLRSLNVVKDTVCKVIHKPQSHLTFARKKYMTAEEINIGFAALLQTFEMVYATQLFFSAT
jgi:Organic solute transporter Ostalpha